MDMYRFVLRRGGADSLHWACCFSDEPIKATDVTNHTKQLVGVMCMRVGLKGSDGQAVPAMQVVLLCAQQSQAYSGNAVKHLKLNAYQLHAMLCIQATLEQSRSLS